jgi:hypothetical protein
MISPGIEKRGAQANDYHIATNCLKMKKLRTDLAIAGLAGFSLHRFKLNLLNNKSRMASRQNCPVVS